MCLGRWLQRPLKGPKASGRAEAEPPPVPPQPLASFLSTGGSLSSIPLHHIRGPANRIRPAAALGPQDPPTPDPRIGPSRKNAHCWGRICPPHVGVGQCPHTSTSITKSPGWGLTLGPVQGVGLSIRHQAPRPARALFPNQLRPKPQTFSAQRAPAWAPPPWPLAGAPCPGDRAPGAQLLLPLPHPWPAGPSSDPTEGSGMSPASSQLPSRPWLLLHNLPAPHRGLEPLQVG